MVRNIVIVLFALTLYSCEKISESSSILLGNQQFKNGDYQGAIVSYLNGIESETYSEFYYYNLGNIYSYIGEYPSAFYIWDQTDGGSTVQMQYNLIYNRGVLEYQLGNYQDAYNNFKRALNINPNKLEAKINLELSLQKMNAANYSATITPKDVSKDSENISDETTRILEYVMKKEEMVWVKTHQQTDSEKDW